MIKVDRACRALVMCTISAVLPCAASAQPIETLGTRAAGLGGAFVAVADDASATYWNPAGLASGAFFSLLIDRNTAEIAPDATSSGASRSAAAIALSTPPLGLSYYRLRHTMTFGAGAPAAEPADIRVDSLVTHHVGVTLVQSLAEGIAVGATLKVVRGVAASGIALDATREELLDHDDLIGRASNTVDADLGIMASLGIFRAGLTVRNVREPEFQPAGTGAPLQLDRQVRAGIAFLPLQTLLMAIDLDLTRQQDPLGDTRNIATGLEGRLHPRATVRGGFRLNTLGDSGRRGVFSAGGSFAVFGSTFVDAQVTHGSRDGDRGWGVGARVLF